MVYSSLDKQIDWRTMKEIKNEKDLSDVFKSGELINEKAIDDNLELLSEIFKDYK